MLTEKLSEKQYSAIMCNCINSADYKLIYSDKYNINNDTLHDLIYDTMNEVIDINNSDKINVAYYSLVNIMRVFFDTDNVYFDNDTDYFICDFETLLFNDNNIFISNNIKIECNAKFNFNSKYITVCSVYNTNIHEVLPVYKFVIVSEYVYGNYHSFEIFSKSLDITSTSHLMAVLTKKSIENIQYTRNAINKYTE